MIKPILLKMFTKILLNKHKYFNFMIAAGMVAAGLLFLDAFAVQAVSKEDIVFPVVELGNCKNQEECKTYCADPSRMDVCVQFAEKHNLISSEEAARAKKFSAAGAKGPGGCASAESCETYCDDISHINECLAFAEKTGLLPPGELEEAKKVQAALAAGATLPGNCRTKDECDAYCENPDHMEECIIFGEAAGFIPPDELEEARKVLAAVKKGAKPPPCRGKSECDEYCFQPENMETCIEFAEAAGLIPPEELEDAKKVLIAVKKGAKPPPCRGKSECDEYCAEPGNFEACLTFAEAAGFIAPEEVEMARKTGGKGPGDCRGREECEAFCQDPANGEICFNFAKEHNLLSEEDLKRMGEGKQQILEMFENAPPEVRMCLENAFGSDFVEGLRSGSVMPREDMGDSIKSCFEQFMPKPGEGEFGPPPGFEGQMPSGFEPGQMPPGFERGQMPPEGFQPPEGFKVPEEFKPPEDFQSSEGFNQPPAGEIPEEFKQQYQEQFQQQYQEQFQQQYQQEYQRQFEEQRQQQQQQMEQQFQQQQPPPSSSLPLSSLLGAIFGPWFQLLK